MYSFITVLVNIGFMMLVSSIYSAFKVFNMNSFCDLIYLIITSSILYFVTALSAWGLWAGIMIISPSLTE